MSTTTGQAGLEQAITQSIDVFDRKVQILERAGFFSDVRRKREALDKLLPTIRVTEDRLLRDLYISRTTEVAGVSRGDIITKINRQPVMSLAVIQAAHAAYEAQPAPTLFEALRDRRVSLYILKP